jgi:hypothetical protein
MIMIASNRKSIALVLLSLVTPLWAADEIVEVTVQGEGLNEDGALKDALRKALEQGGKTEIFSHSEVENFELIRDTIYSKAEGIVQDYQVLEKGPGVGGTFFVKIKALVNKNAIASSWGAVQNVLDQIGRPKVMVLINEKIDGRQDDSSILESKIEERLIKSGFDVYSSAQLAAIKEKEAADAEVEENIAKLQALAKDFDTQIFIVGNGNADAAGIENIFGVPAAFYNCDAMVKMYYTDTARLLASESIPVTRRGAQGKVQHSPQAGKQALHDAGAMIIEKVYATVMQQWATQISAGGEISLEIEGMKAADAIKLKKKLTEVDGIDKVNGPKLSKGMATFRIVAKISAEQLAEVIVEDDWADILELVDIKLNRLQCKAPGA